MRGLGFGCGPLPVLVSNRRLPPPNTGLSFSVSPQPTGGQGDISRVMADSMCTDSVRPVLGPAAVVTWNNYAQMYRRVSVAVVYVLLHVATSESVKLDADDEYGTDGRDP